MNGIQIWIENLIKQYCVQTFSSVFFIELIMATATQNGTKRPKPLDLSQRDVSKKARLGYRPPLSPYPASRTENLPSMDLLRA